MDFAPPEPGILGALRAAPVAIVPDAGLVFDRTSLRRLVSFCLTGRMPWRMVRSSSVAPETSSSSESGFASSISTC